MREKQPVLDGTGQNGAPEPPIARGFLYWLEELAGCDNQEELARAVKSNSRTLRRFAKGEGGRKTAAHIASELEVPLWVVYETMFPAIAAVHGVWLLGPGGEGEARLEAMNQALEAASRVSVVALLARVGQQANEGKYLHPADIRALFGWLRSLGDWPKEELARRAGLSRQSLWNYRSGEVAMGRHVLRWLADGVGLPLWLVEGVMLPAITTVRLVVEHSRREEQLLAGRETALTAALPPVLATGIHFSAQEILEAARRQNRDRGPSIEDRTLADALWQRLKDRSPAERLLLVKNCREFHSWSLVERLCAESENAAGDSAKSSLHLTFLALRVARMVREEDFFCLLLEGYAFLYIGNSRRVAGKMTLAEEAFSRGLVLWAGGLKTRFIDLLPAWRVLDLEGSLRRDQRRFSDSLERLDCALDIAPREARGRILLKKASTLNQMADSAAAISVLEEAVPYLESQRNTRVWWVWNLVYVESLCHLSRFREAQDWLPKAQQLAADLGDKRLDRTRLAWVAGRIAAGLGELEEALAAFVSLQVEFEELGMAYDYALVSLDAGVIMLEHGRLEEVKDLALKMEWIFRSEEIHSEAAKSLDLFRRAAENQRATPELARSVVRFLYRAQHNPELKFAA